MGVPPYQGGDEGRHYQGGDGGVLIRADGRRPYQERETYHGGGEVALLCKCKVNCRIFTLLAPFVSGELT